MVFYPHSCTRSGLQKMSNLYLEIGSKTFSVSRELLCQNSNYFRDILAVESQKKRRHFDLNVLKVSEETFDLLLGLLGHHKRSVLDREKALEILNLAKMLQMPKVIEECEAFLQESPGPSWQCQPKVCRPIPSRPESNPYLLYWHQFFYQAQLAQMAANPLAHQVK